jgi:hypothetical protein
MRTQANMKIKYVRFQILTAASMKMAAFWVVATCSLVNFYQTTRRNNPEDSYLQDKMCPITINFNFVRVCTYIDIYGEFYFPLVVSIII